ncbi:MAG: hypothetical protein ACR2QR_10900, partial [Woeseiaceae bacterium]
MSILRELKRRKVFQVATVYAVVAWILVEIVTTIEEPLGLPTWVDTFVIVCLGIGFPVALILSWAFDVTPDGIQVTGKAESGAVTTATPAIAVVMQGLVLLAVSFLLLDRYWLSDITANDRTGPVDDTGVTRFSIPYSLADSEFQVSFGRSAVVSPDGGTVLIGRPEGLVVRPVSSLDERLIVESGRLNSLAVSPDGRSVAYWE